MKLHEVKDYAWAAGFLEGEGCFGFHKGARLCAVQVQREPLERLLRLFGGIIYSKSGKGVRQDHFSWNVNSGRAIGIMMTLFPFMSPVKMAQIVSTIRQWKAAPGKGWRVHKKVCSAGHEFTAENTKIYVFPSGRKQRQCRACANTNRMKYYYANQGGALSNSTN